MSKLIKIIGRFTGGTIEWTLILFIIFAFAIRTSTFQTLLARQATNYLSKELQTTFRIDRVSVVFFDRVALDGVFVLDKEKDTLASLESVLVKLKSFSPSANLLAIREVNLQRGLVKISRKKENGDYNYWFIQDYFDSGKQTTKSKPLTITLAHLRLTRMKVHYDDYRKSYSAFGMDYDHLKFKNVYLFAGGFTAKNGTMTAFIKHLSCREKGGFELDKFSTAVRIDEEGLKLKELRIETPFSKLYLPKMYMLLNEMVDFETFEDSVTFDARIEESKVSMKDISYFATALEGMNQQVTLEADVTNKVKNLKIANLKLATGKRSKIRGTINLPDFREFNQAFFQEKLNYVYVDLNDLQQLELPKDAGIRYVSLNDQVNRLGYFEATDLKIDGFYSQFVVEADRIKTNLGTVRIDHGIMFSENKKNNSFLFEESQASDYDVKIDSFQLGQFLNEPMIGSVFGKMFMNGEIFDDGNINFNHIEGEISRFDFNDYKYKNIVLSEASFTDQVFSGIIDISDENLEMTYKGFMDFNTQQQFDFDVDIHRAQLNKLHWIDSDSLITLSTIFQTNLSGSDINNYSGDISLQSLLYQAGKKSFDIPSMQMRIDRNLHNDRLQIQSKILNAVVEGKVDFNTIATHFNNQFSVVFPALFDYKKIKSDARQNHFTYGIRVQEINDFLAIFAPDLIVSPGTTFNGTYSGATNEFTMNVQSKFTRYANIAATNFTLNQEFQDFSLNVNYQLASFSVNDTLSVKNLTFVTTGSKNLLHSDLKWNPNTSNESNFSWNTNVQGLSSYVFDLLPSYFSINENRWNIDKKAHISFLPEDIHFDSLLMYRENQFISVHGAVSSDTTEKLLIRVNDLQLYDFTSLFSIPNEFNGIVNGDLSLSNPFDEINFNGIAHVKNLFIDKNEVGDVNLSGYWDPKYESINLQGDLFYKKNKTFNFSGFYYLYKEYDNLNFGLDFDQTNIQFASSFLDPDVVTNVRGLLQGRLAIRGTLDHPKLNGSVNLLGGNAKIDLFGVNFGLNGKIDIDEDMIKIDNMPIIDEEGNTGAMNGTIIHNNFENWNFDLFFNLEEYFDPIYRNLVKVDNFLVMNTGYEEGSVYYGKAYATGNANISGYTDNLEIIVNMKTERNSNINFPMYESSEIDEDLSFIWESKNILTGTVVQPQIDFTGVSLDLNFDITPDATIKLIFDEQTGDEITAKGKGKIGVMLNNMNDLTMDGTFTVTEGDYRFVLGVLNKNFKIQNGGTITWNGGGAEEALLDIKTTYNVVANVNEIVQELESKKSTTSNQQVNCNLLLTGSLSDPLISFEIKAPKASESAKAAIDRINSDKDELNRQFFSLLVGNKFQPTVGAQAASYGSGAALDALAGQINTLLGELSKDVRLNVNLQNNTTSGQTSGQIGFVTNVLNDKLTIKGSFGVENNVGKTNQSQLIGDLNLEYTLDENGNFKVSIFNESNDYTVIQDKNLGQFTQGVGLQYQEEFQSTKDFILLQTFLDLFRKDKKIKNSKKKSQKPVPPVSVQKEAVLNEE